MPAAPTRKPPSLEPGGLVVPAVIDAQFSKLTQQFETLKSQVRQAQQLASLGTASAMIAHETSNLLTPILSYAEYASDSNDMALMKKALSVTVKNVRILVKMSERVLEISAASPPQRTAVPVRQAVEDAVASLCRDLSKDGITLRVDVEDSLQVVCDALQLQQVLFNMLLNAREAMAPSHSGRLTVTAGRGPAVVSIRVHNTGAAISSEMLPHVFDALQTTKPATRDGRRRCGGLGLALCRDLVEENGGTIGVTSDEQSGTCFTITLPSPTQ